MYNSLAEIFNSFNKIKKRSANSTFFIIRLEIQGPLKWCILNLCTMNSNTAKNPEFFSLLVLSHYEFFNSKGFWSSILVKIQKNS